MLTWRSCTEFTLRHTVQRNWFMPLVNALNWLMRSWVYICLKTGLCFPNLENKEPKSNQDAKSKEGRQFLQLGADLSTVIDRGILINQPRSSENRWLCVRHWKQDDHDLVWSTKIEHGRLRLTICLQVTFSFESSFVPNSALRLHQSEEIPLQSASLPFR